MRVYGWVAGDRLDDIAEQIARRREQGLDAVKCNASAELGAIDTAAAVAGVVERATIARPALGSDGDFALDFHGRVSPPMARRILPPLEPLLPLFVEEPVAPELAAEHLPRITASTSVPIASEERAYSRRDVAPLLAGGIAVAQPDVSHAGGISETRRIASSAEMHGASIAPHSPLGPIALTASLQVDLAAPNVLIQEQSRGIHHNESWDALDLVLDTAVFDICDGHIARLTGPGPRDRDRRGGCSPGRRAGARLARTRVAAQGWEPGRMVSIGTFSPEGTAPLWSGLTAVVTGGSEGIGAAIGHVGAREQGRIWLLDVDEVVGERTAPSIRRGGAHASFRRMDVTDEAAVTAVIEEILAADG